LLDTLQKTKRKYGEWLKEREGEEGFNPLLLKKLEEIFAVAGVKELEDIKKLKEDFLKTNLSKICLILAKSFRKVQILSS